MEKHKSLIIKILVQDMKHEQLINGLKDLGFESDLHGLELVSIVAELMGAPELKSNSEWFDGYMNFLSMADQYEITGNGRNLIPLAETCYMYLKKCVQNSMIK